MRRLPQLVVEGYRQLVRSFLWERVLVSGSGCACPRGSGCACQRFVRARLEIKSEAVFEANRNSTCSKQGCARRLLSGTGPYLTRGSPHTHTLHQNMRESVSDREVRALFPKHTHTHTQINFEDTRARSSRRRSVCVFSRQARGVYGALRREYQGGSAHGARRRRRARRRRTRGHRCKRLLYRVEDTKLSTNKQHSLSR